MSGWSAPRRLSALLRHLIGGGEQQEEGDDDGGGPSPAPGATAEDYEVGEGFLSWHAGKTVRNAALTPRWAGDDVLWYVRKSAEGADEICLVDLRQSDDSTTVVVAAAQLAALLGAEPEEVKLSGLQLLSPSVLLLRHDDTVFRCDLEAGTAEPVPEGGNKSEIPSPDGALTLFAHEHNLHVRPSLTADEEEEGNAARPLTTDGEAHHSYGGPTGATWVTLSRKDPPQQPRPAAIWSPDSTRVLTSRVDERAVEDFHLIQSVPEEGMRPKLWSYKYSLPGDPVPPVEMLVIEVHSGRIVPIDTTAIFGDEHDAEGSPVRSKPQRPLRSG